MTVVGPSKLDRVACQLGRSPDDLREAIRKHAGSGKQRVATLSVRLNGTRLYRYSYETSMDRVAREINVTADELRKVMRCIAADEGKERGIWTLSVRIQQS